MKLPHAPSYVIVENVTGRALFETYSRRVAEKVNPAKARAIPIGEYLASLNRRDDHLDAYEGTDI